MCIRDREEPEEKVDNDLINVLMDQINLLTNELNQKNSEINELHRLLENEQKLRPVSYTHLDVYKRQN